MSKWITILGLLAGCSSAKTEHVKTEQAKEPSCKLVNRKVMGPMLKLTYQCGEKKDIVYRYVGEKGV